MEALLLTISFLSAAGVGYIPVKMLGGYKDSRRRQNLKILDTIKSNSKKCYGNSD